MKPPPFKYLAAHNVGEALAALAEYGDEAKLLAGGQSLMPMLNFRLLRPAVLIDINPIADLGAIEAGKDALRIGALARHHALETSVAVRRAFPVLSAAMAHVAHLAIRNRGTIGGSLAHADPAAELPMMAVLLDAELTAVGPSGARAIPAGEFFQGALTTALDETELVTEIRLPYLPPSAGWGFAEVARRSGDFALAAASATLTVKDGAIEEVRLAVMGVDDTPLRITAAETMLHGQSLDDEARDAAAEIARDTVSPESDLHASADYRRHLAAVLTRRVLAAAWQRANAETP